jgi:predicted nucleic acid-binding protein
MVVVDTSIWIDFLYKGNSALEELLINGSVDTHEFIIGELACGNIKNRKSFLELISKLPTVETLLFSEIMFFIRKHELHGKGLGFIDCHILASVYLNNFKLWTKDKKLEQQAERLSIDL